MSGFIVRRALITDAAEINQLCRVCLGYDYPPEETEKKLKKVLADDSCRVFAAVISDRVAGFVHAESYDLLYYPHMKNILGIAVFDEYRRMGIGTALLNAVEDWARASGAAGVRLVSGAERTGAHEFYRRCGYGGGKNQINFKKRVE